MFYPQVCPYTSVGKTAVQRHFLKVHVTNDANSPKLLPKKTTKNPKERWVVKGEVKKDDTFVTADDSTESDMNSSATNEVLHAQEKHDQRVIRPKLEGQDAKKDSELVKKSYKCGKCDHTSSRRTSLEQHVKRVHEECENYQSNANDHLPIDKFLEVDIKNSEKASLALLNSGKVKTEHLDAKEPGEPGVDEQKVKTATKSDTKTNENLHKPEKRRNTSSKSTSIWPSTKRVKEDCEEESVNVGKITKAERKMERERTPLAQLNKWPSCGLAKNGAIQISLESLVLLQGIAPSQAPKCV